MAKSVVIKALGCDIILKSKRMPKDYLQELPSDANLKVGWPMKQGCAPVKMWHAGFACIYETFNTRNTSHNYWQVH